MPITFTRVVSWLLFTVGAALFVGTGAALLTYRRTGRWPGAEDRAAVAPHAVRGAVVKCVVGGVAGVVGAVGLSVYGTAI